MLEGRNWQKRQEYSKFQTVWKKICYDTDKYSRKVQVKL